MYGIVQGGVHEDLRVASAEEVAAGGVDGIAIGGSLGADKPQMHEVVGWTTAVLDRVAEDRPRHAPCPAAPRAARAHARP